MRNREKMSYGYGIDWIVEKTLWNIEDGMSPVKAFAEAADDANYYGVRPDVVEDRKVAARILRERYGHKSITDRVAEMDPIQILEISGEAVPLWYKRATGTGFVEENVGSEGDGRN